MNLKQHPLSSAFPAMQDNEYQSLVDSIAEIGVQNPITIFEGMVIDGWHRYTAANQAGMACPTVDLGDVDPRDFVLAQNKARRHITQGQLGLATTACYAWRPAGNPTFAQSGTGDPIAKTNAELAAIAGIGIRSIKQAKAVQKTATPEIQEAVKRGDIGLPKAAAIAKLPASEQAAALAKPLSKPAKVEVEDSAYTGPSDSEILEAQNGVDAEMLALQVLIDADDKLGAAVQEVKRLHLELAAVKSQRDGYMNQANELIRRVKSLKKMLDKAQGK